jgi:hypothetical protein
VFKPSFKGADCYGDLLPIANSMGQPAHAEYRSNRKQQRHNNLAARARSSRYACCWHFWRELFVRRRRERLTEKLSKLCGIVSAIAFSTVAIFMDVRKQAISMVGQPAVVSMVIFILITMGVGWLMGGPAQEAPPRPATGTRLRLVALCLLIALHTFPGPKEPTLSTRTSLQVGAISSSTRKL